MARKDAMEYFKRYRLMLDFFITEFAIILLSCGFIYILFCVMLRKKKRGMK